MALVYASLLALIPLLAVSLAVLKAFGADTYLEPLLLEIFRPLGGNASSVAAQILDYVKRLEVGVLGSVGLLSLLYTSVSLLEKVEECFNSIWNKKASMKRSFLRRFSDYLSFILIGPLLIFSAFGGANEIVHRVVDFQAVESRFGILAVFCQALLPYTFIVATFTLVYRLIPKTRVRFHSAFVGGLVAGILWKLAGLLFAVFVSGSAQYHAVYSTFAILILAMLWLYFSWLIVLLGVQISFYHQYPRDLFLRSGPARLGCRRYLHSGLLIMAMVGRRFVDGRRAWSAEELAGRLGLPDDCVDELLGILSGCGFVLEIHQEPRQVVPARDLSTIALADVVDALLRAHENELQPESGVVLEPQANKLAERIDEAVRRTVGSDTLHDLVAGDGL